MTLLDEPRLPTSGSPDAEALIEEARRRQRRRWWSAGLLALLVAVGAAIVAAASGGGHPTSRPPPRKIVPASVPVTSLPPIEPKLPGLPLPAQFVASGYSLKSAPAGMTSWGTELVVVSTRTGRVTRVLARGRMEVLAQAGRHVFFVQLPGNEVAVDYEVSIAGGPVRRLGSDDGLTPSPNGDLLAYEPRGSTDLKVRDLTTDTTTSIALSVLAPRLTDPEVKGVAWMSPGNRLAALISSNGNGPVVTQLVILDLRHNHHLVVSRIALPAYWIYLFRSSRPNTLLGGEVLNSADSISKARLVQMTLSAHGRLTIREFGKLPTGCAGVVQDIDPSAQHVLCAGNPLDVVRFVRGSYRIVHSIGDNRLVILGDVVSRMSRSRPIAAHPPLQHFALRREAFLRLPATKGPSQLIARAS